MLRTSATYKEVFHDAQSRGCGIVLSNVPLKEDFTGKSVTVPRFLCRNLIINLIVQGCEVVKRPSFGGGIDALHDRGILSSEGTESGKATVVRVRSPGRKKRGRDLC